MATADTPNTPSSNPRSRSARTAGNRVTRVTTSTPASAHSAAPRRCRGARGEVVTTDIASEPKRVPFWHSPLCWSANRWVQNGALEGGEEVHQARVDHAEHDPWDGDPGVVEREAEGGQHGEAQH